MAPKLTSKIYQPPSGPTEIADKIVYYGAFLEAYQYLTGLINSEISTSIIIRGNAGSGKKSLLEAVSSESILKARSPLKNKNLLDTSITCEPGDKLIIIYLNPSYYTDDFMAIERIAATLKLKPKHKISELIYDIEEQIQKIDKKILIVLLEFEEFCRKRQCLLYSLTHLIQHTDNAVLVGVTLSLDPTENLEKRVRSRLNAHSYELSPPYRNKEEYVEFASALLGNYKIVGNLKAQLENMHTFGLKSIRELKRYLISMCSWDSKGDLTVNQPTSVRLNMLNDISSFVDMFTWLTTPQQEILLIAASYCKSKDEKNFTLKDLELYAKRHNYSFDFNSPLSIRNVARLAYLDLIRLFKPNEPISELALIALQFKPIQLKKVVELNSDIQHSIKTSPLLKYLR